LSALGSLQKVGLATTLCFATACEVEDSNVMNTRPRDTVESEIFGGQVDTTHDAVVYLEGGGSCTGTIITAKNGVGWVLTAGHCDTIDYIIIGDDLQAYDVAFNVVQDVPHPQWSGDAGNGYDFRLLRFSYSGGDPPVIPAATGDAGLVGQTVTHVGYGLTENGSTNKRRAVNSSTKSTAPLRCWALISRGELEPVPETPVGLPFATVKSSGLRPSVTRAV
jgi:hypothetical protein